MPIDHAVLQSGLAYILFNKTKTTKGKAEVNSSKKAIIVEVNTKNTRVNYLLFLSVAVVSLIFVHEYIHHEEPLYSWDYGAYWHQFQAYGALLRSNPLKCLKEIVFSVRHDSYSALPVIPILPFFVIFGGGRVVYISALTIIYLIPVVFLSTKLVEKTDKTTILHATTIIIFALLYTPFWAPTLRGYVGIGGLIPLSGAILLAKNTSYLTTANIRQALTFGILLWASFLFRRWYTFSVLGVGICSVIMSFVVVWNGYDRRHLSFLVIKNYITSGITGLLCGIIFQGPLLLKILHTNYSKAYSAYEASAKKTFGIYVNNIGIVTIMLVFIGLVVAINEKNKYYIYLAISAAMTALLFSFVQAPGLQHILPIAFLLFPIYMFGILNIIDIANNKNVKILVNLMFICVFFLLFSYTFTYLFGKDVSFAFPKNRYQPLSIENFSQYRLLTNELKKLPKRAKFVVFAASSKLNSSLITSIAPELANRLIHESDIDARDGFDWHELSAKFVVLGTPNQTQFSARFQRVITVPANEIRNGTEIGRAYRSYGVKFSLADHVYAQIFEKKKYINTREIVDFARTLYSFHHKWKNNGVHMMKAVKKVLDKNVEIRHRYGKVPFKIGYYNSDFVFYAKKCSGIDVSRRFYVHVKYSNGAPVRNMDFDVTTKNSYVDMRGGCYIIKKIKGTPVKIKAGQYSTKIGKNGVKKFSNYWGVDLNIKNSE